VPGGPSIKIDGKSSNLGYRILHRPESTPTIGKMEEK